MRFLHVPPNDRATAGEAVKKAATALFDLEAHSNVNRACSLFGGGVDKVCKRYRHPSPRPTAAVALSHLFSCKMTEIKCKQLFNNRPRQIRSSKIGDDVYYAKLFMCHRALPERSRGVRPLRRELLGEEDREELITQSDKAGRKETEDGWRGRGERWTDACRMGYSTLARARITLFCRIERASRRHDHHAAASNLSTGGRTHRRIASEDQRGVQTSLPPFLRFLLLYFLCARKKHRDCPH